jgi:hypothetical protein
MNSPAEKIKKDFERLGDSLKEFKTFSKDSKEKFLYQVTERFKPLIKKIQEKTHTQKTYLIPDSDTFLDLDLAWQAYLSKPAPTQSEIRNMIQKGLGSRGLENNSEFKKFLERQDDKSAQAKLFRYLYKYLLKILILARNSVIDSFWIKLTQKWQACLKEPNNNQAELLKSFLNHQYKSKPANFINSELTMLEDWVRVGEQIEKQKILEILQFRYHLDFSPADEIYQMFLGRFFEQEFNAYKSNRLELRLNQLLETFCELSFRNDNTYGNFNRLFEFVYNFAPSSYCDEKQIIIKFCKKHLGDPRIDHDSWAYLKNKFRTTYNKLSFWFKEQDFDLFFKFVFKNQPDPHGRQKFWKNYLDGIEDIRFFLGENSEYNEFLRLSQENGSSFKPLINSAGFNAFILKFVVKNGCVYIYDVTETGNACYVYFDGEGSSLTSSKSRDAKKVLNFLIEIFKPDSQEIVLDTKKYLVHTELTEQISMKSKQPKDCNWRIAHDSSSNWEKHLSSNLTKFFHIKARKELSDGYR